MGLRLEGRGVARPRFLTSLEPSSFETPCEAAWLLTMRAWCWRTECGSRNWLESTRKPPRSRGFRPGCAADEDGGRGAPGRRCFSKRWVTTRRSSLGDFGHSRLALRREGSDRHRGCYPTDPTGEGCPSFRRDRFPPSLRAEFSSSRGQVFHPVRRAGLPLSAGADENPPPAKPEGFHPPTYAPRHPQRVHGGTPFSVAP